MSLKIMVVDDEPEILKLFKAMVEPLGFEVLTVADSREAAQRVEQQKFDGIFLDVHMPHLSGIELTQRVRRSPSNSKVPVVILTGLDDAETMRRCFEAGATFFLAKPFTQERVYGLFRGVRGSMLRERCRYARLPLRTTVDCHWGEKRFKSTTVNISGGGILLQTSVGVPVGQELELEFMLPEAVGPLKVRTQAVRNDGPDRLAVRFTTLRPEEWEALQNYISKGVTL